jgi:hypothetical protein
MNEPRIYPLILVTEARWSWILTALQFGISFRAQLPVLGSPSIFFKELSGFCALETIQTQRNSWFWVFERHENQRTVCSVGLPKEPPVLSWFF